MKFLHYIYSQAHLDIYRIHKPMIYITIIDTSNPLSKGSRDLPATPANATGDAVELATVPLPNADRMRPPKFPPEGVVEVGEGAPATKA